MIHLFLIFKKGILFQIQYLNRILENKYHIHDISIYCDKIELQKYCLDRGYYSFFLVFTFIYILISI